MIINYGVYNSGVSYITVRVGPYSYTVLQYIPVYSNYVYRSYTVATVRTVFLNLFYQLTSIT